MRKLRGTCFGVAYREYINAAGLDVVGESFFSVDVGKVSVENRRQGNLEKRGGR